MPGKVIGKVLNFGYPGTVSRSPDTIITPYPCSGADILFGDPVALNADLTVSKFSSSNTADDFVGFAVRSVKQAYNYEGDAYYRDGDAVDVLTRGYISVHVASGTPTPRSAVSIVGGEVTASGAAALEGEDGEGEGGGEAPGGAVILSNAIFTTSRIDANGVTEVTVLTRAV